MRLCRRGGKKSATQQSNSQLNLTVMMCFPCCLMLWVVSRKTGEEIGTCYQRLEARALKNTLHVLCGWPNRRGGLKVDSSVMHDSGTAFSANSTLVLLTARSAFYSLRSTHAPRLCWFPLQDHRCTSSANWWASRLSSLTYNRVCVCVSM